MATFLRINSNNLTINIDHIVQVKSKLLGMTGKYIITLSTGETYTIEKHEWEAIQSASLS